METAVYRHNTLGTAAPAAASECADALCAVTTRDLVSVSLTLSYAVTKEVAYLTSHLRTRRVNIIKIYPAV